MTRLQINDQFGNDRLRTQAAPIAATQVSQAAPPPLAEDKWKGLGNVFAGAEMLVESNRALHETQDKYRASKYANSMTVDELGKRIKAGDMLTSESPVFAATVQHIWGQNSQAAMERDVLSKVTTGEMKFAKPEDIDNYLTESRNTTLAGQSQYASAGFDKGYANLRTKLMDSVAKVNDKAVVEQAANVAADSMGNKLLEVTGADFKGTPQEAAQTLLSHYDVLRRTKAMPDAAARGALTETITRAAATGKTGVVDALLNSELPDLGTVRSFLGETKAATLIAQAGSQFDQGQRQRIDEEILPFMQQSDTGSLNVDKFMAWAQSDGNKKYTSAAQIHAITRANMASLAHQQKGLEKAQIQGAVLASEHEARGRVDAAMTNGTLWTVQGTANPQVLTTSGDTKDFNVKKYAEDSLTKRTAGMPFEQQVSAWAMNGLANPDWENQMKAGLLNLSSIGLDSKGKPTGELNGAGTKAIELFKLLDGTNPDYAKQVAGDTAYKRFSDIAFLTHLGRAPADAASIASNVASGAIVGSDTDKLVKKVHAAVDGVVGSPWTPDWALRMMGDNTNPNTAQVTGTLRRYSTLLAHSGQYGSADEAVKAASEYLANPKVSARVNGTLYLRSEMPAPPANSGTQEEWFERFVTGVPKARAKELGFDENQVRMEYDPQSKAYRGMVGGVPITRPEGGLMVIPAQKIQEWYATQRNLDIVQAAAKGAEAQLDNTHDKFVKRMSSEIGPLQKGDKYVMERYGGMDVAGQRLFTKDAYRRITADGNADKPLSELMKIYPAFKAKQPTK